MAVKFTATPEEREIVTRISRRVAELYMARGEEILPMDVMLDIQMDLNAVHSNGCPMDFARLENADDFNLLHDVAGIARHLDRSTGKLTDMFRPRFAKKEEAS
ncbi:MAG: hypothetical protein LKH76_08665 [Acetobacter fabarum]|jgi:hypothetical protein|uniref:DUF6874 family protein n=1 Tax=Acetobacter fabarum TaxID=483199 RepID=UPI0024320800|nr:hypothetical protein [Acetobacter fabarum]MCH4025034.1 hypothetical protein [Acetobacter fabarum]MCH4128614.1 hypothetical protein [Acetobacter fabarum]MCH4141825.1 hypothetical protein [Acetobacter fabarum]MCI1297612.1 hypothetical protein [Acetobacter fabarum]MCI1322973.1 hypothetical protein [Acetobacter fabarum]